MAWGVNTVNVCGGPALAQCWVGAGGGDVRGSKLESPKKMESSLILPPIFWSHALRKKRKLVAQFRTMPHTFQPLLMFLWLCFVASVYGLRVDPVISYEDKATYGFYPSCVATNSKRAYAYAKSDNGMKVHTFLTTSRRLRWFSLRLRFEQPSIRTFKNKVWTLKS